MDQGCYLAAQLVQRMRTNVIIITGIMVLLVEFESYRLDELLDLACFLEGHRKQIPIAAELLLQQCLLMGIVGGHVQHSSASLS